MCSAISCRRWRFPGRWRRWIGSPSSWRPSEALGLLGRSHTSQVRASDLVVQAPLDEIRLNLAGATLEWAKRCGFPFRAPPFLQMFPVRMLGDAERPPHQEPHVDSNDTQAGPPICTNVFYARVLAARGGELAVGQADDLDDPVLVAPDGEHDGLVRGRVRALGAPALRRRAAQRGD